MSDADAAGARIEEAEMTNQSAAEQEAKELREGFARELALEEAERVAALGETDG